MFQDRETASPNPPGEMRQAVAAASPQYRTRHDADSSRFAHARMAGHENAAFVHDATSPRQSHAARKPKSHLPGRSATADSPEETESDACAKDAFAQIANTMQFPSNRRQSQAIRSAHG